MNVKTRIAIVAAAIGALSSLPVSTFAQKAATTAAAPVVVDVVIVEPEPSFRAALESYAKKDAKAAAADVRKGADDIRAAAKRASGDVKRGLDASVAELSKLARDLDKGAVKDEKALSRTFARAYHALALSHREAAAKAWANKAYDRAAEAMKASANDLEKAAAWAGGEVKDAANAGVSDARAVGDKIAKGADAVRQDIAKGFEDLGGALDRLGKAIGSKAKARKVKAG